MILHNWDDDQCVAILDNCHRSLEPGGTILISELVIPQGNAPFFGKLLDLISWSAWVKRNGPRLNMSPC